MSVGGFIDLPALSWVNGNGLYITFVLMSGAAIIAMATVDYSQPQAKNTNTTGG
jgi:hypothetical protein